MPESRKSSRNAELSVFTFSVPKVSTITGIGGVVVAKRRTVVTLDSSWIFVSQKRQQSQASGESWSRNAEQSSLLDWSRLFASEKCQQSQASGESWSRNAERSSLLDLCLRVSKVSTITGIGGGAWSRNAERSSLLDLCFRVSKSVNNHRDRGGRGRENGDSSGLRVPKASTITGIGGVVVAKRKKVVTFGLVGSSRLKSVNNHKDRGGRGRETQNGRHFWTRLGSSRLKSVNSQEGSGGPGRETQDGRHFWTRLGSSRLKSVNNHRDRGGRGRETQNGRHFWPCLWRGKE